MLLQIRGSDKDLGGGFHVRRLLPSTSCRAVGPFVFLDHFGPTLVTPGMNIDVRPHPHIGLATVTYLLEGAMTHRDSLGSVQRIEPGAINWMSAGRGIVHSERTPEDLRQTPYRVHGLQFWCALPKDQEEGEPHFDHTPADRLAPRVEQGAEVRVLIGEAFGRLSPVNAASPTVLLAIKMGDSSEFRLPPLAAELALVPLSEDLRVDGQAVSRGALAILPPLQSVTISAAAGAESVILGGDALDGPRHLWWNFVSSRPERLRQAAEDWAQQRFDPVPGETEFIPAPALPSAWTP
ncbi:MAG: pirin family protein [Steroidobacteraceae bacterium]